MRPEQLASMKILTHIYIVSYIWYITMSFNRFECLQNMPQWNLVSQGLGSLRAKNRVLSAMGRSSSHRPDGSCRLWRFAFVGYLDYISGIQKLPAYEKS